MSSSKIMANSLDDSVFDGVAREESVQSVLSAVQNSGSSPSIVDKDQSSDSLVNSLVDSNIYSVTGKGKLYFANIITHLIGNNDNRTWSTGSYITIKIAVDNNVVAVARLSKGSSTGYTPWFHTSLISDYTNNLNTSPDTRVITSDSIVEAAAGMNGSVIFATDNMKPISFENGFDVYVSKQCASSVKPLTSYTSYEIGYSLIE